MPDDNNKKAKNDDDFRRAIMGEDYDRQEADSNADGNAGTEGEEITAAKPEEGGESIKNAAKAKGHEMSLKETIVNIQEDEAPMPGTYNLKKILGGDFLTTNFIHRQIKLIIIIIGFIIMYITNRYSVQRDLIEIDKLQKELKETKYKALYSTAIITEKSRESHILQMLQNNKDSTLKMATQPPYMVEVPK